jgi:hypothetical protein
MKSEMVTLSKMLETHFKGLERTEGGHHGRLAVEQAYGYMVHDKILYGIISTFNSFVFIKRESPGILHMSRMIPNNSTTPTIMKLLYFFSYLCARDPVPPPETNSQGIEIHLTNADKTTSATPKIPNPNLTHTSNNLKTNIDTLPSLPRRSPRHHGTDESSPILNTPSLYFDITAHGNGAYLGCKGWRGSLSTGHTVFAKLWDGWKFSPQYCEHEASIYLQMRDLWGVLVPEFLGSGDWGFCYILLLSYIEVSSLSSLVLMSVSNVASS